MQKKPKATAAGTVKKHANDNGKYSPTPTPQRYTSGISKKPTERRTGNNPTPQRYTNGIRKKPTEQRTGNTTLSRKDTQTA